MTKPKYRGPDITLGKRTAVGHGECQGCGHHVTWYEVLPDEEYANCVLCSGFMIVTRAKTKEHAEDEE